MTRRLVVLPAVAGLVAVIAATIKGLYVSPDAVFYVGTARNWLDGRGFTPPPGLPPVEHFPPFFTMVLAAIGRIGPDPLTGARVVNALAFAGIVLLVGLGVRFRTGSVAAGLVAALLAAAAVDLLTLSASALSEPLFILLGLSGLLVLAAYLDEPRPALLAGAGALVAAALLTRYVGIALVVAGVAALLWRRRWGAAAVFGAGSLAPVALWVLWARSQGPGDRTVAFHMFGAEYLGQAARPLARWLVPWPKPPVGLILAVLLVAGGVAVARRVPASDSSLAWLLLAFTVAYVAVLLANRALTDATGRLDARFLAPLHVVAILLVVPALWRRKLPAPALALAGAVVLGQVAAAAAWTAGGLTDESVRRRGYSASALPRSPLMVHGGEPLHTNAVDAVFFVTGRPSTPVPATRDYLTGRPNDRYAEELAAMRASGGYLAYFDAITFRRSFLPSRAELEAALPLEVVATDALGTLYRFR
ncbi:MAG: glycosyltransferase family 39 protein [Acidimicrobiales bacterium]